MKLETIRQVSGLLLLCTGGLAPPLLHAAGFYLAEVGSPASLGTGGVSTTAITSSSLAAPCGTGFEVGCGMTHFCDVGARSRTGALSFAVVFSRMKTVATVAEAFIQ